MEQKDSGIFRSMNKFDMKTARYEWIENANKKERKKERKNKDRTEEIRKKEINNLAK